MVSRLSFPAVLRRLVPPALTFLKTSTPHPIRCGALGYFPRLFSPAAGRNPSRFSLAAAGCYCFSRHPLLALFLLPLILYPAPVLAYKNVGAGSSSIPCNTYYQGSIGFNYSTLNLEYCDGTNWDTVLSNLSSDDQIDLGTSVTATNPSISGDLTSGLFTPAASTVAIATGGVQRMTVNSSGYVGIGTTAPAAKLDVWGAIDVNGVNGIWQNASNGNLAVGATTFPSTINPAGGGLQNTAVGPYALYAPTTAQNNIGIGFYALNGTTTASGNVAVGGYALWQNPGGSNNTAIGFSALAGSTSGQHNTAVGYQALHSSVGGWGSVAVGESALSALTTGGSNTAIGYGVGSSMLQSGTDDILIGTDATTDTPGTATSNFMNIGNTIYATNIYNSNNPGGKGYVGIGTTTPGALLDLGGTSVNTAAGIVFGKTVTAAETNLPTIKESNVLTSGSSNDLLLGSRSNTAGILFYTGGDSGAADSNSLGTGSSAARMVINSSGLVGIGTTAPQELLDLGGYSLNTANGITFGKTVTTAEGNLPTIKAGNVLNSGSSNDLLLGARSGTGGIVFYTGVDGGSGDSNELGTASNAVRMVINSSGYIGIGTAVPAEPLEIYSSGAGVLLQLAGSGGTCNHTPGSSSETVSCTSDMRLKSGVIDAPSALPWLSSIRVRDFTWKSTGQKRTGVIAQELQKTHPEMVTYDKARDQWTVDQPNPWTLVKILQEQQAEIDDLKNQLASKR